MLLALRVDRARYGPLGVSELFDRPLPTRCPMGADTAPSSADGREPERADRKRMGGSAHEGTFWRVVSAAVPVAGPSSAVAAGKNYVHWGQRRAARPLSREEEGELIARLAGGGPGGPSTLIEHNLRLVVYIARRFENTGINIEDLISIGTIGLIKAVGTYQPAKNIKLATYASRCIENEILMHLRKTASLKSEVPFDEPLSTDWNGNELLLSDILGTESDLVMRPMEEDVDRQLLADALKAHPAGTGDHLPPVWGLAGREHTQKEVADRMGISQSYISRLEKRIIGRLKLEILKVTEIP